MTTNRPPMIHTEMTTNWPPTIQTDFIFYSVWDLVLLLSIVAVIIAI
jgi:hypothetical protein